MRLLIILLFFSLSVSAQVVKTSVSYAAPVAAAAPSNMISNGTFGSGDDWTAGGNWAIGSGVATYTTTATSMLSQASADMVTAIEASTSYTLTFTQTKTGGEGTRSYLQIMNSAGTASWVGGTEYDNGTVTITFTTGSNISGGGLGIRSFDNFMNFTIDDITLTED